jgi:acetyltransferase-like isoleucine patch superfamily enzyme
MNTYLKPLSAVLLNRIGKAHQFLDHIRISFLRKRFQSNAILHPDAKIYMPADIQNFSQDRTRIIIRKGTVIRGDIIIFAHNGKVEIGEDCYVGEHARIWSASSIKIGNRVLISHNVNIHDTNAHSTDPNLRHLHFKHIMEKGHPFNNDFDIVSLPVVIGDDVWIGFNSTILKGVTIGEKSIVSACSVVTESIPPHVIVAGNPARITKKL